MAVFQDKATLANVTDIEGGISAFREASQVRGKAFCIGSSTGTMAAGLAANAQTFAMRLSASAPVVAIIERVRLEYVTIVTYTTPIVNSRRFILIKYGGLVTAITGGTGLAGAGQINPKDGRSGSQESWFSNTNGGDIRITSTANLTITGGQVDSSAFADWSLANAGTAGNYKEFEYGISNNYINPIYVLPGQILLIRNPQAFDAVGTWQATITVDWHEVPIF